MYLQNNMKKAFIAIALATLVSASARADEGMWMVHAINRALEAKMQERGLKLAANEIYNADAEGASLSDAIVSLDFSCTGSVISDNGLVITNHHCAYSDVFNISTPENNYLDKGYWAFYQKDEVPIPHKGIQFLKKVLDVTEEVQAIIEEHKLEGKTLGSRKLSYIIEQKYEKETGLRASLEIMWSGSKYYLALYKNYSDIRLVAAPPVSIAAFGGDIDNWEWPQHKGDFAMYRIYTAPDGSPAEYSEENVPLKSEAKLKISTAGYGEGDYTMVIGFPGSTARYSSSAKMRSLLEATLPVSTRIRGNEMAIIKNWMDKDPDVRLLYADWFFSLSNAQELHEGEIQCCKRFGVIEQRMELEKELQEWIDADPARKERWGNVINDLNEKWKNVRVSLINETLAREAVVRASKLGIISLRIQSAFANPNKNILGEYEHLDMRVEKDIIRYTMGEFFNGVDRKNMSNFHKEMLDKFNGDTEAIFNYIWDNSILPDVNKMELMVKGELSVNDDPLFLYFTSKKIGDIANATAEIESTPTRVELQREYTRAMYQMFEDKGIPQCPDANSSMRITYGTVGGFEPYDAVMCDWKSTTKGILEKYSPDNYDFSLFPEWKEKLGGYNGPVDFICDCDITGGNSGSPVMNASGELIGLAFDGNKESLASDLSYTPGYNKCVCVDIRYILYILKEYAKLDRITAELGL